MRHLLLTAGSALALASSGMPGANRIRFDRDDSLAGAVKALEREVKESSDKVKATAEQALGEVKKVGKLTDETKAQADEALRKYHDLAQKMDGVKAALEGIESRQIKLAQDVAAAAQRGPASEPSFGQDFAANESIRAFAKAGSHGTSPKVVIDGHKVHAAITSLTGSAGDLIIPQREREIVSLPRMRLTIRSLIPAINTTSNLIEYAYQTVRDLNAAPVSEGAQKPESNLGWELTSTPVRTIAHWTHASRQAMDDVAQLQGLIDSELRYGLALAEEQQLLNGDGTGQNLLGLIPQATAYAPAFNPVDRQQIDDLRLAILQVALNEFSADGIVLHPTDWAEIELLKDGQNRYLWSNPRGALATPTMWGLPIVPTTAMTLGEFLVGAFGMAANIYDRMGVEVLASSEDRDNFIKNMITIRAEERLALAVKRALSLVHGAYGTAVST